MKKKKIIYYAKVFPTQLEDMVYAFIIKKMLQDRARHIKIVTGEGLMFINNDFLDACMALNAESEGGQGVKVEVILYNEALDKERPITRDDLRLFIKDIFKASGASETSGDLGKNIEGLVEKLYTLLCLGVITIYLAPGRPKWHFTIQDDIYLYLQEEHPPKSKKKQVYIANDAYMVQEFSKGFEQWKAQCAPVEVEGCNDEVVLSR